MRELENSFDSRDAVGPKSIATRGGSARAGLRSGRAFLGGIAVLCLAGLCAALWLWMGQSQTRPLDPNMPQTSLPENSAERRPAGEDLAGHRDGELSMQPALGFGRSPTHTPSAPGVFDETRLDGRGHIRGFVQAAPGVAFPQEWVLSVGPSTGLIGRERAETRRLEFHGGEQEFDLPDLPFGGYMLRATAFGLASGEQHMLLARPNERELYVVMQLEVTAFVEGSVRYEDSTPAVGLALALEPRSAGTRVLATSGEYGDFLFTDVKSGAYTLHIGSPENPVREPIEVNVGGSPERLADVTVPKMCELLVRTLHGPGAPATGVKLEGYGDHGGRVAGETNANGEYRARFLPEGRITVIAIFPDGERVKGRKVVSLEGLELLELVRTQ